MKTKILLIFILIFTLISRLYKLDLLPLYSDEADQGYNAYSVMETGRDEHGQSLPVSFRSFGDWKPPVQTYLMIPFIRLLGLNEYSVRLPGAFTGVFSVYLTFLLVKQLFSQIKNSAKPSLLAALFLAVSPWHMMESRSAMLVMISLFFLVAGIFFFLKGVNKRIFLIFSSIAMILSVYSYYGMRVIIPLVILVLFMTYRKNLDLKSRELILSLLIGLILLLPLAVSFVKEKDVVLGRARTVSIFYDQGVKLTQWSLITQDGISYIPLVSRFFHNSLYLYVRKFAQGFLSHFDPRYLFVTGDLSPPFTIPGIGIIYILDGLFIPLGMMYMTIKYYRGFKTLFLWLIISYVPAALTFMVPAANRTFNAVIPLMIFAALGLDLINRKNKGNIFLLLFVITIFTINTAYFFHEYFINLPLHHAEIWNFGMKEITARLKLKGDKYDNVVFTGVGGMPYIYLLFYNRVEPALFQKLAVRNYVTDRFGFEHVDSFGKYIFYDDRSWSDIKVGLFPKSIYIIPAVNSIPAGLTDTIKFPDGKSAYYLIDSDKHQTDVKYE